MDSAHLPLASSSSSSDAEEDVNHGLDLGVNHRFAENSNRVDFPARGNASIAGLELNLSCFIVVLIFWFFVSVTLIIGVYGPKNVWIGPNSSILVEPNSIFVQSIKVKELNDSKSGLELFGFYKSPPLDVFVNWSESHLLSVSHKSFKELPYYLNEGTSLNISYSIEPEDSSVQLLVYEGSKGVSQWLNEASYPYTAFSWNLIKGNGMIELKITKSSSYFVSVANLNMKDVQVELHMDVRAVLYDTKHSFYKCIFTNGECTYDAMSLFGNYVVLTSPAPTQGTSIEEEWYIRFSYQPRWIAYIIITGAVICFMLVAMKFIKRLQLGGGERDLTGNDSLSSQRTRLIANKDEDGSSMDSSNESFAADDADLEGNEGEASNSNRSLCAICFDASRDCFFLPCGHCLSCYQCGTNVAEAAGSCPICRRKIKKVKRIYTV